MGDDMIPAIGSIIEAYRHVIAVYGTMDDAVPAVDLNEGILPKSPVVRRHPSLKCSQMELKWG